MTARPNPALFLAAKPRLRARIEEAIERLIMLLDQIDGDPDFEPANDDEPSLGWVYSFEGAPMASYGDGGDDREIEDEHGETKAF